MSPSIDDPRLDSPQCASLTPVRIVHENPWFTVRDRGGFFSVEYNEAQVAVLPIVEQQGVVMVRVKRPLLADSTLELPAGGVERDESPAQAAARELAEESGIAIEDITRFEKLPPLSVTPRFPRLVHVFQIHLTWDEFNRRKSHDHEIESTEVVTFEEVATKIQWGEIYLCLPLGVLSRFLMADGRAVIRIP